jgi:hypothetical protein
MAVITRSVEAVTMLTSISQAAETLASATSSLIVNCGNQIKIGTAL